jgi:hypothetical protein
MRRSISQVWCFLRADGTVGKVLSEQDVPSNVIDSWPAEADNEAWWDEIQQSGKGRKYLGHLAAAIGDGRNPEWFVSARALRIALHRLDKLSEVEAIIRSLPYEWSIVWEYATEFNRFHPMVAQIGQAVDLDDDQLDQIWELAEQV